MESLMKKRVKTGEASRNRFRRTATVRIARAARGARWKNGLNPGDGGWGFKRFLMQLSVLTTMALLITASYHLSVSNPFFDIKHIVFSGNRTVTAGELEEEKANIMGMNIFKADLEKAGDSILENPWIESISIERRFPSSLYVTIREREPSAEAFVSGRRYYIDANGLVLGYGENYSRKADFLMIVGFDEPVMPGEPLDEVRISGAYELQELFERETAFSDRASMVDAGVADRLRVITDSGVSVTFGPERELWKEKFLEYIAVRKILSERGESAESIDLSFKGQVVVTRRKAGASAVAPTTAGKKADTSETGRNNNS